MDVGHRLNRFQFNQLCIVHDDICTESFVDRMAIPVNRDRNFRLYLKICFSQFIRKDSLIDGFKKPLVRVSYGFSKRNQQWQLKSRCDRLCPCWFQLVPSKPPCRNLCVSARDFVRSIPIQTNPVTR